MKVASQTYSGAAWHWAASTCCALGLLTGCYDDVQTDVRVLASPASDADASSDDDRCGNGSVDASEECDPAASGWEGLCDPSCKRSAYKSCTDSIADCGGEDALCAAYVPAANSQFCADFCKEDTTCPVLPGFEAACNFAWCAVLCDDGACPTGMVCARDVKFLDFEGSSRGPHDVCIISP